MSKYHQNLFEKFVKKDISPQELESLLSWISKNENFKDVNILEKIWIDLETSEAIDKSKAIRIQNKLKDRIEEETSKGQSKVKRLNPWLPRVAAGLIFLVLCAFGLVRYLNSPIVVKSDFGEIVEVNLPDNSKVFLNANSQISYPRRWNAQEVRTIILDGEAFFEVSKDLKHHKKFVVNTKDLSVEVLGTEFNVNTRHEKTKVFLESGSVKLNAKHREESIMMEPGELASIDDSGALSKLESIDVLPTNNWKKGSMVLKDKLLSEILREYELVYGEKYQIGNMDLLEQSFTIIFPIAEKDKSLKILQDLIGSPIEKEIK